MVCVEAMLLTNQIAGIGFCKGLMFKGNYKPISN